MFSLLRLCRLFRARTCRSSLISGCILSNFPVCLSVSIHLFVRLCLKSSCEFTFLSFLLAIAVAMPVLAASLFSIENGTLLKLNFIKMFQLALRNLWYQLISTLPVPSAVLVIVFFSGTSYCLHTGTGWFI